jgi:DNA-binding CsgD family transcriptional regulator
LTTQSSSRLQPGSLEISISGDSALEKLIKDEIVTLQILKEKVTSNRAIARKLGVTEAAVRYHLCRQTTKARDGRKKRSLIQRLELTSVVEGYQYSVSYKSVRKYVQSSFEKLKLRPFRRVETPPGAQTQSDWMEEKKQPLGHAS